MPRWNPGSALAQMAIRPSDISPEERAARVSACASCKHRIGGDCSLARQMISVHALKKKNTCPAGRWPQPPAAPPARPKARRSTNLAPSAEIGLASSAPSADRKPITMVMASFHRPDQAAAIARRQKDYGMIARVIVWNNNPEVHLAIDGVDCINATRDVGLFETRFAAAALARTDCVLIQDDDIFVPEATVDALFEHWQRDPAVIHGTQGRNVDGGVYSAADCFGSVDIVLTRCLLIHRDYCLESLRHRPFFQMAGDGEDIVLSAAAHARSQRKNRAYQLPYENLPEPHPISGRPGHLAHRTRFVARCAEVFGAFQE